MNVIRILISELIGMFIDDGSLAAFSLILVIVVGTIRLIGSNSNNVFSSVASAIQ